MEYFTLKKLWDLRGELNQAIINKNYKKIKEIKIKYINMIKNIQYNVRDFINYNRGVNSSYEEHKFIKENMILIYKNIEAFEKKYIKGEDVSVKLKQQNEFGFLAADVWVIRAMFDKFVLQTEKENLEQSNMILGKAMLNKINDMSSFGNESNLYELLPIKQEIQDAYNKAYGLKEPRTNFAQLSDEFAER